VRERTEKVRSKGKGRILHVVTGRASTPKKREHHLRRKPQEKEQKPQDMRIGGRERFFSTKEKGSLPPAHGGPIEHNNLLLLK